MALSGPGNITEDDLRRVDEEAAKQAQYFDRFEQEVRQKPPVPLIDLSSQVITIQPPGMTAGQFAARAEQYGNSVWQATQRVNTASIRQNGVFSYERRVMGHPRTEHCHDCPPLAALGWQPIGSLPAIGDSECGPLCLCHFEYSGPDGKPHVVAPPKPKPVVWPGLPAVKDLPGTSGPPEKKRRPVRVQPVEPTIEPPMELIGPWVDKAGNAITYHYEEAE